MCHRRPSRTIKFKMCNLLQYIEVKGSNIKSEDNMLCSPSPNPASEQAGPDKQKKAAEGWEHCSFSPTPLYLPRMPGESR